jgi:hypothetical protein
LMHRVPGFKGLSAVSPNDLAGVSFLIRASLCYFVSFLT